MGSFYLINPLNLPNLFTPIKAQINVQYVLFSIIFLICFGVTLESFTDLKTGEVVLCILGLLLAITFIFLVIREKDNIDEEVISKEFEEDFTQKMKLENEIKTLERKKELYKLGGNEGDNLKTTSQNVKVSLADVTKLNREIEMKKAELSEINYNLRGYDRDFSEENSEIIKQNNEFSAKVVLQRDMTAIQNRIEELRETGEDRIKSGSDEIKRLLRKQEQILEEQKRASYISGNDDLIDNTDFERSNINSRIEYINLLKDNNAKSYRDLVNSKNNNDIREPEIDNLLVLDKELVNQLRVRGAETSLDTDERVTRAANNLKNRVDNIVQNNQIDTWGTYASQPGGGVIDEKKYSLSGLSGYSNYLSSQQNLLQQEDAKLQSELRNISGPGTVGARDAKRLQIQENKAKLEVVKIQKSDTDNFITELSDKVSGLEQEISDLNDEKTQIIDQNRKLNSSEWSQNLVGVLQNPDDEDNKVVSYKQGRETKFFKPKPGLSLSERVGRAKRLGEISKDSKLFTI